MKTAAIAKQAADKALQDEKAKTEAALKTAAIEKQAADKAMQDEKAKTEAVQKKLAMITENALAFNQKNVKPLNFIEAPVNLKFPSTYEHF